MSDPAEIFARAFDAAIDAYLTDTSREAILAEPEPTFPGEGIVGEVREGFQALRDAGWRIVRPEPAGVWAEPTGTTTYFEDEDRPDAAVELFTLTEEWNR